MEIDDQARRKTVVDALAKYQGKGDLTYKRGEIEKALKDESHRGLVIILVSFIEDALLERLIRELPKGADHRRDLSRGPLKSVENRIAMGKALGILTEREAIVLDVFKAMRNACAHSRLEISFDTPELRDALALVLREDGADMIRAVDAQTRMGCFITCATYLLTLFNIGDHKETYALMDSIIERLSAENDGKGVPSEKLLLASLQEMQQETPSEPVPVKAAKEATEAKPSAPGA
jgi:hypothetical protein